MSSRVAVVGEPTGQRWELALDLLRSGQPFSLGPVTFRRTDQTTVEADIVSSWPSQPVTEAGARKDLEEAKGWVEDLLATDEGFRSAVGSSEIDFVLVHDYELGHTRVCRLTKADELEWLD